MSAIEDLTVALGLQPGASKRDILNGVQKLLDDDEPDGGSDNKTATSRTASDPRPEMAALVDERMTSKGVTFKEAFAQISRDPRHRALTERVERYYDPNLGLRGR